MRGLTSLHTVPHSCMYTVPHSCMYAPQIAGVCVGLGIAIVWGVIVGAIITYCNPFQEEDLSAAECFDDGPWCAHCVCGVRVILCMHVCA